MKIRRTTMKIRVSNLPRENYIRRTTMKIRVSNLPRVLYKDHYENKGVKPASCFI